MEPARAGERPLAEIDASTTGDDGATGAGGCDGAELAAAAAAVGFVPLAAEVVGSMANSRGEMVSIWVAEL